ncbi:MAG TPA: SigB/SigF/SigG family RNA polymerase sigma factor [Streptosporangiaceae bacterium]|nr:SigB/SigF/SigG family RNA polymerase sigma factor [Streptosporangiaceae bacterium]
MGIPARHQPDGRPAGREPGEQEQLALVQARPPGDPERDAACEALVTRYANIVRACAARYRDSPESAEDLIQVGYVGLMKAINNFDPEVGDSLAAYARPCVSGEIKRHFRDKRWQIRVRRSTQELRLRIGAATADLTQELSRPPSDAELAVRLGVTEAEVADAQLASQAFQVASLDAPLGSDDGSGSLAELMGAEDPQLEHALDIESVWKHCAELPRREQHLLMMRFYGNMSQDQIGAELGISQMHVSRLLSHALTYLRDQITEPGRPASAL